MLGVKVLCLALVLYFIVKKVYTHKNIYFLVFKNLKFHMVFQILCTFWRLRGDNLTFKLDFFNITYFNITNFHLSFEVALSGTFSRSF